jgi:hypothetical protein
LNHAAIIASRRLKGPEPSGRFGPAKQTERTEPMGCAATHDKNSKDVAH